MSLLVPSRVRLCDPMDYSSPGSSVHGILQGRTWSGYPFPSPGDRPNTVIEPGSPALQADSLLSELPGKPLSSEGQIQIAANQGSRGTAWTIVRLKKK